MSRIRVDDLHRTWMKDPEYCREYGALEEEFSLVAALIEARTRAGLTQASARQGLRQDGPKGEPPGGRPDDTNS